MADNSIIISLATYNKRLSKIFKTFPSIVKQTVSYDKIIVNVQDDCTDEEFSEFEKLKDFSDKVEVIKRPAKWRSFNKYLHVYSEYPDSVIITCDDDIVYEDYFFKALYDCHIKHPENIICHEVNPMIIEKSTGEIRIKMAIDIKLGQTEFGKYMTGCCLFPPHIFDNSKIKLNDYDKFIELTDGVHDEIWLWTLSTLLGKQCICLDYTISFDTDGSTLKADEYSLSNINGNLENVKKYEEKINRIYGNELLEKLTNIPCVFNVRRTNLLSITGNMGWINSLMSKFNVVFECNEDEILRSHLIFLINSINSYSWYNKITVKHSKFLKD